MIARHSLLIVLLFSLGLGKPLQRRAMQVHESRPTAPNGFTSSGSASSDTVLSLRIALAQSNIEGLIDSLYDVSTPSSANYGQYLTQDEVAAFVTPTSETVLAVNSWLSENGLTSAVVSPFGDWLEVSLPAGDANDLLDADFTVFTSTVNGESAIRTLSYSIPTDLVDYVSLVHPTISFPSPSGIKPPVTHQAKASTLTTASSNASDPCALLVQNGYYDGMNPACLQSLYGIPATPATVSSNHLAVTEYQEQYAWPSDLETFLEYLRPDMNSSTTFSVQSIDGGVNNVSSSSFPGIEADLDIQYTVGLATDVPVSMITVGGGYTGSDFLTALLDTANTLVGENDPPQVVSTSYGIDEFLISSKFATTLCNAYAQLSARGVSILFASGDGGVSGSQDQQCEDFVATFPSGCPYVTSVGGTVQIPETAVDFSGGGFSNIFVQPAYQTAAVAKFLLQLGQTNSGLFNPAGRGYPDVAAYAVGFNVSYDGFWAGVSGTSCASPTWASVVALLNDRLLAAGKPVLGFLNPWLYSRGASAVNDIVYGSNAACGIDETLGFNATVGWDPVTGLGTPNFGNLLSAVGL